MQDTERQDLISTVVSLTGLPEHLIESELGTLLEKDGHSRDNLTLDELRIVMLKYLESVNEAILERNS